MTITRLQAEQRLAELRPQALALALSHRDTIQLSQATDGLTGGDNSALVNELRRAALRAIASTKREEQALRSALAQDIWD